ncbi:uncharacterized protein LOC113474108 isoform X2 [Ciona intestinalis]
MSGLQYNMEGNLNTTVQIQGERLASVILSSIATAVVTYVLFATTYFTATRKTHPQVILINVAMDLSLITSHVEPFCTRYSMVKILTYGFSLLAVYSALWLKVYHCFYLNAVIINVLGETIRTFVAITYIFLLTMGLISTFLFLFFAKYVTKAFGCVSLETEAVLRLKWGVLISVSAVGEIALLFYFIYPVYVHKKRMKKSGISTVIAGAIIKRSIIAISVCTITNIMGIAVKFAYISQTAYVFFLYQGMTLVIHLFVLVLSHQDWKTRLFPWIKKQQPISLRSVT